MTAGGHGHPRLELGELPFAHARKPKPAGGENSWRDLGVNEGVVLRRIVAREELTIPFLEPRFALVHDHLGLGREHDLSSGLPVGARRPYGRTMKVSPTCIAVTNRPSCLKAQRDPPPGSTLTAMVSVAHQSIVARTSCGPGAIAKSATAPSRT